MNSLYIVIAVILVVIIFYPKITISENQIYSPLSENTAKLSTPRFYDFYIPQLTNEQTPISTDSYNNQMNANMLTRNTYLNDDNVTIIRQELSDNDTRFPKYILKDTLSKNTIGTGELSPFHKEEDKPYTSFTDENISQYPKFYNSDIKNELTNVGKFFDKKNRYSDSTNPNSSAYIDDSCYVNSDNSVTCLENTRLQNIPPKNTSKYKNYDIGNYRTTESKDSVMNGLSFYDTVFASKAENETFSPFVETPIFRECLTDV
jgi:hypothetical protein